MTACNGGNRGGTQHNTDIFYMSVPGSTTSVTITTTNFGAALDYATAAIYWASGLNPTPTSVAANVYQILSAPATVSNAITTPASGASVFFGFHIQGQSVPYAFTGVTAFTLDGGTVNDNNGGINRAYSPLLRAAIAFCTGRLLLVILLRMLQLHGDRK